MAAGLRNKVAIDYRAMSGLKSRNDARLEDVVHINVDKEKERELLGEDLMNSSRDDVDEDMLEFDEDELLQDMKNLSPEQVLAMVADEEQRCKELELVMKKKEMEERRQAELQEEARQKAMREAWKKLKSVRSRRVSLEKSLNITPDNSLATSPELKKTSKVATSTPQLPTHYEKTGRKLPPPPEKPKIGGKQIHMSITTEDNLAAEILAVIKDLRQGNTVPFARLMSQAMTGSQACNPGGQAHNSVVNTMRKAGSLPNVALYSGEVGHDTEAVCALDGDNVNALNHATDPVKALQSGGPAGVVNGIGENKFIGFDFNSDVKPYTYSGVVAGRDRPEGDVQHVQTTGANREGPLMEEVADLETESRRKGKPLKSGILTCPDEAGIRKVVRYAHEKLSRVHVKSRTFTDLSFHNLVAGELELVLDELTKPEERVARLHFLRTLAYHRECVGVEDIKDQYDANLKEIERGAAYWCDFLRLTENLHTNLTFRATVKNREWEAAVIERIERLTESKKQFQKGEGKPKDKERIIYCSDYNKGACPFSNHHEGMFNRKSVTKWHVCHKCLALEGNPKKFHPGSECNQA